MGGLFRYDSTKPDSHGGRLPGDPGAYPPVGHVQPHQRPGEHPPPGSCAVGTGRPASGHFPHRPSRVMCSRDRAACLRSLSPPPLSGPVWSGRGGLPQVTLLTALPGHVQSGRGGLPQVTLFTAPLESCVVRTGRPALGQSPHRPSQRSKQNKPATCPASPE